MQVREDRMRINGKAWKPWLVLAALLLGATSVQAANRYVRAGATGGGNGSDWANAYPSLPGTLVRGDTYYIAVGSYGAYTFDDALSGSSWIHIRKATSSAHGTDEGWDASYGAGQAVFSEWKFRSGRYDVDGVTGGGPGNWESGHGIKVIGASSPLLDFNSNAADDILIRHVEATSSLGRDSTYETTIVQSVKDEPTEIWFSRTGISNVTFEYCYFHDIGAVFFHTFHMDNVMIQYNKFARNGENHPEMHREVWSAVGDDRVTWRWNWIEDSTNTAVFAYVNEGGVADGIEIYGNMIVQTGLQGVHASFFIDAAYTNVIPTNWKVCNNTLVGWISGGPGIILNTSGSGNQIYNNIWALHPASDTVPLSSSHDYNGFHSIIHWVSKVDMAPSLASGESHGQRFSTDPFVNSSLRDYRLKQATNAGIPLPSPYNVDMLGNVRGEDGVWDRGAFEFVVGNPPPVNRKPNPPTDVQVR
jgi:hypothetical protein